MEQGNGYHDVNNIDDSDYIQQLVMEKRELVHRLETKRSEAREAMKTIRRLTEEYKSEHEARKRRESQLQEYKRRSKEDSFRIHEELRQALESEQMERRKAEDQLAKLTLDHRLMVSQLRSEVAARNQSIQELQQERMKLEDTRCSLTHHCQALEGEKHQLELSLNEVRDQLDNRTQELTHKLAEVDDLRCDNIELRDQVTQWGQAAEELERAEVNIKDLTRALAEKDDMVTSLNNQLQEAEMAAAGASQKLAILHEESDSKVSMLQQKLIEISKEAAVKDVEAQRRKLDLECREDDVRKLRESLAAQDQDLQKLKIELQTHKEDEHKLRGELQDKDKELEKLRGNLESQGENLQKLRETLEQEVNEASSLQKEALEEKVVCLTVERDVYEALLTSTGPPVNESHHKGLSPPDCPIQQVTCQSTQTQEVDEAWEDKLLHTSVELDATQALHGALGGPQASQEDEPLEKAEVVSDPWPPGRSDMEEKLVHALVELDVYRALYETLQGTTAREVEKQPGMSDLPVPKVPSGQGHETDRLAGELEDMTKQRDQLLLQADMLRSRLEEEGNEGTRQIRVMKEEVATYERALKSHQETRESLVQAVSEKNQQLAEERDLRVGLEDRLGAIMSNIKAMERQVQEMEKGVEPTNEALEQMGQELLEAGDKLEELIREKAYLEEQLKGALEKEEQQALALAALQQRHLDAQEDNSELSNELWSLKGELMTKTDLMNELQQQLSEVNVRENKLSELNQYGARVMEEVLAEMVVYARQRDEMAHRCAELEQQLAQQAAMADMQLQLESALRTFAAGDERSLSLRLKLANLERDVLRQEVCMEEVGQRSATRPTRDLGGRGPSHQEVTPKSCTTPSTSLVLPDTSASKYFTVPPRHGINTPEAGVVPLLDDEVGEEELCRTRRALSMTADLEEDAPLAMDILEEGNDVHQLGIPQDQYPSPPSDMCTREMMQEPAKSMDSELSFADAALSPNDQVPTADHAVHDPPLSGDFNGFTPASVNSDYPQEGSRRREHGDQGRDLADQFQVVAESLELHSSGEAGDVDMDEYGDGEESHEETDSEDLEVLPVAVPRRMRVPMLDLSFVARNYASVRPGFPLPGVPSTAGEEVEELVMREAEEQVDVKEDQGHGCGNEGGKGHSDTYLNGVEPDGSRTPEELDGDQKLTSVVPHEVGGSRGAVGILKGAPEEIDGPGSHEDSSQGGDLSVTALSTGIDSDDTSRDRRTRLGVDDGDEGDSGRDTLSGTSSPGMGDTGLAGGDSGYESDTEGEGTSGICARATVAGETPIGMSIMDPRHAQEMSPDEAPGAEVLATGDLLGKELPAVAVTGAPYPWPPPEMSSDPGTPLCYVPPRVSGFLDPSLQSTVLSDFGGPENGGRVDCHGAPTAPPSPSGATQQVEDRDGSPERARSEARVATPPSEVKRATLKPLATIRSYREEEAELSPVVTTPHAASSSVAFSWDESPGTRGKWCREGLSLDSEGFNRVGSSAEMELERTTDELAVRISARRSWSCEEIALLREVGESMSETPGYFSSLVSLTRTIGCSPQDVLKLVESVEKQRRESGGSSCGRVQGEGGSPVDRVPAGNALNGLHQDDEALSSSPRRSRPPCIKIPDTEAFVLEDGPPVPGPFPFHHMQPPPGERVLTPGVSAAAVLDLTESEEEELAVKDKVLLDGEPAPGPEEAAGEGPVSLPAQEGQSQNAETEDPEASIREAVHELVEVLLEDVNRSPTTEHTSGSVQGDIGPDVARLSDAGCSITECDNQGQHIHPECDFVGDQDGARALAPVGPSRIKSSRSQPGRHEVGEQELKSGARRSALPRSAPCNPLDFSHGCPLGDQNH